MIRKAIAVLSSDRGLESEPMKHLLMILLVAFVMPVSAFTADTKTGTKADVTTGTKADTAKLMAELKELERRISALESVITSAKRIVISKNAQIKRLGGVPLSISIAPADPKTQEPGTNSPGETGNVPKPPAVPLPGKAPAIGGGSLPQPLAMYSFDRATTYRQNGKTYLRDLAGDRQDGEMQGVEIKPGLVSEAGYFPGKGQSILLPKLINSLADNRKELSVSCWVKPENPNAGGRIFSAGWGANSAILIMQYKNNLSGSVLVGKKPLASGPNPNGMNQWTHVVLSWDGQTSSVFLDGKVVGMVTNQAGPLTMKSLQAPNKIRHRGSNNDGWNIPRIGTQAKALERNKRSFQGHVDELVIFPKALSTSQVKMLFNGGKLRVSVMKLR